jgi:hypothetical protein
MDQNTSSEGGKKSSAVAPFTIYRYLTSTTIHIAIEVIIACAFFAYFQRKMNKQREQYDARILVIENQVKSLIGIVDELVGAGMQKQFTAPEPKRAPEPKITPEVRHVPEPKREPPTMGMNFLQDFMKGSLGAMFDAPKPPLSTIEEVIDESDGEDETAKKPISREQLDKELSEELGELAVKV